jgi:hypothetical protein
VDKLNNMIEFFIEYTDGLKKLEKTYNFDEENDFESEFINITNLFSIEKSNAYSLEIDGTHYHSGNVPSKNLFLDKMVSFSFN